MKKLHQSKSVQFQAFMGAVSAILGSVAMLQSFLSPEQYTMVFMGLSIVQAAGGVYLRSITSEAIG